ncbi:MAG: hypothetical protein CI949_1694 [Halanaerobium sp.]|nr:MAG: hypothetical protein CI949_1694 [Halanaerobium sp.]
MLLDYKKVRILLINKSKRSIIELEDRLKTNLSLQRGAKLCLILIILRKNL